ncbi:hypothetical protein BW41_01219 [Sphingomonas sp. RIT328]|nr:hypothetical protein BW41_01219 [Sphingomonas sp. RIT328]
MAGYPRPFVIPAKAKTHGHDVTTDSATCACPVSMDPGLGGDDEGRRHSIRLFGAAQSLPQCVCPAVARIASSTSSVRAGSPMASTWPALAAVSGSPFQSHIRPPAPSTTGTSAAKS